MLAGRPHEAVGNGSPRWMTAAPCKRAHRTRPTGRLTPIMWFYLRFCGYRASRFRPRSARISPRMASMTPRPRSSASGNRCPYVSIVSVIVAWPSLAWITFGLRLAAISVEA